MNIIVFDPLYSSVGHFFRYNKFILTLLSSMHSIKEIYYISNENEGVFYESISPKIKVINNISKLQSIQISSFQTKGISKIKLYIEIMRKYIRIIKYINESKCDFCMFTSNGMVPFWLATILKLRKKYIVSVISLKWIFDKFSTKYFLYAIYLKFLHKATLVFVTEQCYKNVLIDLQLNHIAVLNDRYLQSTNAIPVDTVKINKNSIIHLITLGTISHEKNPIEFVKLLKAILRDQNYRYDIYGKSLDSTGKILSALVKSEKNINYFNTYISNDEYNALMMKADFIVIPYDSSYTKFMTSGVMWDCFEHKKPIICPNLEPFRFYIGTYNIGYIYTDDTLAHIIEKLLLKKGEIYNRLQHNYEKLYEAHSYLRTFDSFSTAITNYFVASSE